ncbi:hypothetical protein PSSU_1232 [Pseudoscardovia suis]|uniref:Uncharacterized protein n=1 Tax=Pseudoscardovia suis TaxID=987063 RepID=A0A261EUH9_9BIFI|nr:hypothetical protein PSSU_1232 [Pseudoscardovia suis]
MKNRATTHDTPNNTNLEHPNEHTHQHTNEHPHDHLGNTRPTKKARLYGPTAMQTRSCTAPHDSATTDSATTPRKASY